MLAVPHVTLADVDRLLGRSFVLRADGGDLALTVSAFEDGQATCWMHNVSPRRQVVPGGFLLASIRAGVLEER